MQLDPEIEIPSTAINYHNNPPPSSDSSCSLSSNKTMTLSDSTSLSTDSFIKEDSTERESSITDSILTNSSCSCSIHSLASNSSLISFPPPSPLISSPILSSSLLSSPFQIPNQDSFKVEKNMENQNQNQIERINSENNSIPIFNSPPSPPNLIVNKDSLKTDTFPTNNPDNLNSSFNHINDAIGHTCSSSNNSNTFTNNNNGMKKSFYGRFWRNVQRSVQKVLKCIRTSPSSPSNLNTFPPSSCAALLSLPNSPSSNSNSESRSDSNSTSFSLQVAERTEEGMERENGKHLQSVLNGNSDVPFSSIVASISNQTINENVHYGQNENVVSIENNKKLALVGISKHEESQFLLPPPSITSLSLSGQHRKCLVLDLDETLVHSSFQFPLSKNADFILDLKLPNMSFPSSIISSVSSQSCNHQMNSSFGGGNSLNSPSCNHSHSHSNSYGNGYNHNHSYSHGNGHHSHSLNIGNTVNTTNMTIYVCKRPGVDAFLQCMAQYFEIVIFTASLSSYADPVIDFIDPKGEYITHRLYRNSCMYFQGVYVKDLSRLGRNLKHTLIVDNSPASYMLNPDNAVNIKSWFNDEQDRELENRIMPMLIRWAKDEETLTV